MNGKLEVESQVGRGTTFRVLLNRARAAAEAAPTPAAPTTGQSRRGQILVVDDEPMIGSMLRRMLSSRHAVDVVTRGADALERIRGGKRYDVILCDLMMPEMTGMDLHAELTSAFPEQAKVMLFLTGGAFTPKAQAFLEELRGRRLDKPFDVQTVDALIDDCVRRNAVSDAAPADGQLRA
jgi:CheY-like chemotaxis protein